MVEHATVNRVVEGSSPSSGAIPQAARIVRCIHSRHRDRISGRDHPMIDASRGKRESRAMKSLLYKLLCITFVVAVALGQTGCGGSTRRQLRSTEKELDEVKKAQQAQQQQLEQLHRAHSAAHSPTPSPHSTPALHGTPAPH